MEFPELTIFQMVGPAVSIIKYVEGGGLESDLASIHTEAAKGAFEKSKIAGDKEAQMRAVIHHLEIAEIALQRLVKSQTKRIVTSLNWSMNVSELFNIKIFMASCYIYLKEYDLGSTMLDRAEDCFELFKPGFEAVASMVSGLYFVNLAYHYGRIYIAPDTRILYTEKDIESKLKPTIKKLRKTIRIEKAKKFKELPQQSSQIGEPKEALKNDRPYNDMVVSLSVAFAATFFLIFFSLIIIIYAPFW